MPDMGPGKLVSPRRPRPVPRTAGAPDASNGGAEAAADVTDKSRRRSSVEWVEVCVRVGGVRRVAEGGWAGAPAGVRACTRDSCALQDPPTSRPARAQDLPPSTRQFWEQAAVAAASLGVCIDLHAVGATALGLPVLGQLPNASGGAMFLYPSPDEAAMPQVSGACCQFFAAHSALIRPSNAACGP
jgi:hypothetical protein